MHGLLALRDRPTRAHARVLRLRLEGRPSMNPTTDTPRDVAATQAVMRCLVKAIGLPVTELLL